MWFALYAMTVDIFDQPADSADSSLQRRRRRAVALGASAIFLYGVGIHAADTIEVLSREEVGVADGRVYDLAYFLDEGLSHYVQFTALFFVLAWFVAFDRLDRTGAGVAPLFLGVAHGVERALGTIEGEKWFMAPAVIVGFIAAIATRRHRVGPAAWQQFFVRYAVAMIVSLPVGLVVYVVRFGAFTPPSNIDDHEYLQVAFGAVVLVVVGTAMAVAVDRRRDRWTVD